jgi:hypothetical protein
VAQIPECKSQIIVRCLQALLAYPWVRFFLLVLAVGDDLPENQTVFEYYWTIYRSRMNREDVGIIVVIFLDDSLVQSVLGTEDHHRLRVVVEPDRTELWVVDHIQRPEMKSGGAISELSKTMRGGGVGKGLSQINVSIGTVFIELIPPLSKMVGRIRPARLRRLGLLS